jgi:Flp pilus assembly protein CpaB
MKSVAYRSRSSWLRITASPFFALAVLLVIFGGIWASGVVDSCWFGINCPRSIEGLVAVPVSVQHIPAYTSIRREHVWNMKTGEMSKVLLPPEQISETMKVNLKDVLGRVLARDKPPGYVFTEADFLPPGSRQGLVGGIPPGKRAVRVEADQVRGLYGLNPGDRFDLIATLPIDADSKGNALNLGGAYGRQLALQADLSNWSKQATVRVLVQNGLLVQPLTTRNVPITVNTLTKGTVVKTKPVQEIVIAVAPEEVAPLTEAMAVKANITTVPRSGHPDDPKDSHTPASQPWSPFGQGFAMGKPFDGVSQNGNHQSSLTFVETVNGAGERELIAVPVAPD